MNVMEELMKLTLLTRGLDAYLIDRYSERKENAEALLARDLIAPNCFGSTPAFRDRNFS